MADEPRFRIDPGTAAATRIRLPEAEAKHAHLVLRLRSGDACTLTDGRGTLLRGQIGSADRNGVWVVVSERTLVPPEADHALAIAYLHKPDRLEFAVEKAVEIGVASIHLFRADRSEKPSVREDRLRAQVQAAVKQSQRAWEPELYLHASFDALVAARGDLDLLVAHEKAAADDVPDAHRAALLCIGPEGGFTDRELQVATAVGGRMVSLGPHRLRAETAALVLLTRVSPLRRVSGE